MNNNHAPVQNRLDLREVWQACRRQRWLSVGVPVALLASTGLFLWWTAPVYEAVTTVRIDQERSGVAVLEALRNLSSGSKITTEMEELRSRTLAESVVDGLDLNLVVKRPRKLARSSVLTDVHVERTAPEGRYTLERVSDGAFRVSGGPGAAFQVSVGERVHLPGAAFSLTEGAAEHDRLVIDVVAFHEAVRRFQSSVNVTRPNREADLVRVTYQGRDAPLVQQVPDALARAFILRRNSVRTQEARSTGEFLTEQIAALHGQLTVTEDELRSFQERHGVLGIEAQSEAAVRRLAEMQADRERLNVERQAVQNVLGRLQSGGEDPLQPSAYRALLGLPSILTNPAAAELVSALNQAEIRRADLVDRRTPEDPDFKLATLQIRQIEEQLSTITHTYLAGLTEHVNGLDRALAGFTDQLHRIPEQELHLARLRRQAGVTEEIYTALQLRLKESEILAAVDDPTVRIVDPAPFPRRPVRPNVPLSIALALMGGMVLGVGSAVAREQVDDTVHSRDDLQAIGRVPVLGAIPRLDAHVQNGARKRVFARNGAAATNGRVGLRLIDMETVPGLGEAYRSLRTNITFSRLDQAPRILVVTSPAPGDGKSTTASNLAITMAQQGHRVLLVDADMRRGRLHESFGARREPGLSNVLRGQMPFEQALHRSDGNERPLLLTTGTVPPNPAELLGSDRMGEVLRSALDTFDVIVIDAPPLNMVTDAAVLARHADGVLVVARAGVTQQAALAYTFEQLGAVKAPVLGSILNDADPQRERYYGSYMDGYYEPIHA